MPSFGMLHRVALVRTDVSGERSTGITGIAELGTTTAVTSNFKYLIIYIATVKANFVTDRGGL
jgi:hypothetical protein